MLMKVCMRKYLNLHFGHQFCEGTPTANNQLIWGVVLMCGYRPHINRLWFLCTALGVVRGTQRIANCMRWFLLSDWCVVPGVTSSSVGARVGARGRTAMWAFPHSFHWNCLFHPKITWDDAQNMSQFFLISLLYYLQLRHYFDIKYDLDFWKDKWILDHTPPQFNCVISSYSDAQRYSMIYCGWNTTASKAAPAKNALK
jgi:hypothetical protein